MKNIIKNKVQKFFGKLMNSPVLLSTDTKGFSLQRSQALDVALSNKSKINSPYILRNVDVDNYTYIGTNSNISNTTIGKYCSIGPNFCCGMGIHPINGISTSPMFYSTGKQNGTTLVQENKAVEEKPIRIANDVFIGVNVTVLDGVSIGNGAVVGAGSVVTKDIPPYAIVVGVPAKIVKYRFDSEVIDKLLSIQWWNFDDDKLKDVEECFYDINRFFLMYE